MQITKETVANQSRRDAALQQRFGDAGWPGRALHVAVAHHLNTASSPSHKLSQVRRAC